jgi:hypothetical protein
MAGKFNKTFLNLPGWQKGFQRLGLNVLFMAAIVAIMIFSFWVCRAGPFSDGKDAAAMNPQRSQAVTNPRATAFRTTASENYSSSVTQMLNKLKNSTDTSSQ